MRAAGLVILPFLVAGCFFNLRDKEDFKSWYYGDPGLAGALDEADCDRYADNIDGQRHPYYLHFRTPEILLQPQGGAHYPARQTAESRAGGFKSNQARCEQVSKGWETFRFDAVDAGWVDTVIPYRKNATVNDREEGFGRKSLTYARGVLYNTGMMAVMKAPVYIVHDILKTLYIPVAGTYYLFKPDEPPETSTEILQVREASSSEGTHPDAGESDAMAVARNLADESPSPAAKDGNSGAASDIDLSRPAAAEDRSIAIAQAEPGDGRPNAQSEAKTEHPATNLSDDVPAENVPEPAGAVLTPETPASVVVGEEDAAQPMEGDAIEVEAEPRPGRQTAQPKVDPGARAVENDGPPGSAEAEAGEAARDDPAALPANTASDARPPTDAKRESDMPEDASPGVAAVPAGESAASGAHEADTMKGEVHRPGGQDQAPLASDETRSAEPPPPDTDTLPETAAAPAEEAAAAGPPPSAETPAESSAADADMPGESEQGAREEPGKDAGQGLPAAAGGAGDAAEAHTSTAPAEDASSPPGQQTRHQAEEDRVDQAVTSLTGVAKGATDSEEGAGEAPTTVEASGEILEEDLLTPAPAGDASPARDAQGIAGADEPPPATAPDASDAAPDPVASLKPDQPAVSPDAPTTPETIRRAPLYRKALRRRVAFLGFHSRAANVDAKTMSDLQAYVWPALGRECKKNLTIVRRGDADYPSALDSLVRDSFGRMNSFELVTLARFSGLNAVVAGTIIDIRAANALSGILWYKSPEGQLRVTIQVEVFDAETGTKLYDRTYVREEEVNELEPGADGRLRSEDLPVLEAALKSVAEEMGEDICDALEDQPWRAFVSGISGSRITLSAGQGAGLKPGNILGVYNSQIIDGLNNQQFFLTGEKVGRIQLINVHPHRSEAVLIEGQGVRDYSVAMPD